MFNKTFVILFLGLLTLSNIDAFAQKTTIWLVRHAEKMTTNPADRDPELTALGSIRAHDLAKALKGERINKVYSTVYKRTIGTGMEVAIANKLTPPITTYEAKDPAVIASVALKENKGKAALIVGHSNTIIPIIKAFNCSVPFEELSDDDYDMLFKVVIDDKNKARLIITHYGDMHHTTEVPVAFTQGKAPGTNTPIRTN